MTGIAGSGVVGKASQARQGLASPGATRGGALGNGKAGVEGLGLVRPGGAGNGR